MDHSKRKRLDDHDDQPLRKKVSIDVIAAASKAVELTKDLNQKVIESDCHIY